MITFEEFDEAIANVAIDAVFPKRDLYMKPVYLHDNKDKKIGMTYVIMPYGSKRYHIGFIREQVSSLFTVWNGKMGHIVFDVDERDGFIRYYHEPELYDRDNGLSHSQIQTIGETLIKYLTSNKEEKDNNEPEETKQGDDVKMNKPVISFDDVQNIITKWLDDNKIEFAACESEAGKFYYDLNDERFIKGELITDPSCDNEQFIEIHASGESPYIKITSSDVYLAFPFNSRLKYNLLEGLYNAIQSYNSDANENVTDSDIEQLSELHREYLNALSKKNHPLQNSPTIPEEESAEKEILIRNKKPIDPFKMVPIFNTETLETNAPYIIKNLENNTMGIVTLRDCSSDYVVFGMWNDDGEYIVEEITVTEFQGVFELYTTNGVKVEL